MDASQTPLTWQLQESHVDGVCLVLDPAERLLNEAMEECVSTLVGPGGDLCSHWVETVIWRLQRWSDAPGVEQQVAEGNSTVIVKADEIVAARSLYEDLADDVVPVARLLPALLAWRDDLLARGAARELPASQLQVPTAMPPAGP